MRLPVLRQAVAVQVPKADLTFASGLLLELHQAIRATPKGATFSVHLKDQFALAELERWSSLTGNALVEVQSSEAHGVVVAIRNGALPASEREAERPIGSRVWFYTNFDCNLACDYCCVRSSPKTARNALGVGEVSAILAELRLVAQTQEIFLTGGEPFLLEDIAALALTAAEHAPTTILTNGMLFAGRRRSALESLPRDRVALQVSLDSPDAGLHDLHRGAGSFEKARAGIRIARDLGFRVRLAATVSTDVDEQRFRDFLDAEQIPPEDRVVRRVALRGFAEAGLALVRADLVPEITFTGRGVYYHPVGATDDDFLVSTALRPVADIVRKLTELRERDAVHRNSLAEVFHCA